MARIVVDVMPKPEILDPQGKAIIRAFAHQEIQGFTGVRQGKRFAAATMLSNPVIEDVVNVAVIDEEV